MPKAIDIMRETAILRHAKTGLDYTPLLESWKHDTTTIESNNYLGVEELTLRFEQYEDKLEERKNG